MVEIKESWLKLLTFCLVGTLGVALAFAILFAGATLAIAGEQANENPDQPAENSPQTFSGMITDSSCGARHSKNSNLSPADCTRLCVSKGANYMLVDGDKSYILRGGSAKTSQFAGTRAQVTGELDGNSIQVKSISALKP